jgi:class 3 adenylate cyclase
VDIAYAVYGEGPPLIVPPNIVNSHLQLELDLPHLRGFIERLSRRVQVIRYDARGTGMSQRDVIDFSNEAGARDILAVADRLGIERFALYGHVLAGSAVAAFPLSHPERVSSVVVWIGRIVEVSTEGGRQINAMRSLMESEWSLYARVVARVISGWDASDASPLAAMIEAGSSPESRRQALESVAQARADMSSKVLANNVPTLIAHMAGDQATADAARMLGAGIPTAHVIGVPGVSTDREPFVYDNEVLIEAIADFVEATAAAGPAAAAVRAPELQLGAMRAILFTDIVGHTEMMQRLGDAKGRDVLREHERITREVLAAHGGAEVKAMGDGFMAWFPSAQAAVSCAVAFQRAIASQNQEPGTESLRVRVGLNAGEPIEEDGDLFGSSVIAASRICGQASGGEIVVSDVVRQLVAGKGFAFADRGAVALRGFDEGVRLWEVRWREGGA